MKLNPFALPLARFSSLASTTESASPPTARTMIQEELVFGSRVVVDSPNFLAFCPYASRFPYETWIVSKRLGSHYENLTDIVANELGLVLKTVLRKQEIVMDDPAYNYVIHTAPFHKPNLPYFSWHIEILPRTTQVAGFEWGSGFYINPVFPEQAATTLRGTAVD